MSTGPTMIRRQLGRRLRRLREDAGTRVADVVTAKLASETSAFSPGRWVRILR